MITPTRSVITRGALCLLTGLMSSVSASKVVAQAPAVTGNWTLHNYDLAGTRLSPLNQITPANVATLTPQWLFQYGIIEGVSNQTTPVVVDGTLYLTDPLGSVYAVDAATGNLRWTHDVSKRARAGMSDEGVSADAAGSRSVRNRGVVYGDGVIYAAAGASLFAVDAKTGKAIPTFGQDGEAKIVLDVIRPRYPDVKMPGNLGYLFTIAPQYYRGVIYIATKGSESHIPGGYVMAVDAKTGKVLWNFNTIPQSEKDPGWDVAGPTWVGGERNGGGIWETPSIDPALGLLYVAVGNAFGDSTKRTGMNLFSDCILALTLDTGTLKWYFQQTHHDVWDYDSGNQPVLFDMQVGGRPVKALAEASKNGYLYILNRETGKPVHPIKEDPVPTATSNPAEHPWPTQPIPYTAAGRPMAPVTPFTEDDIPPARLANNKLVPHFSPPERGQISPGGGANYGPLAYSSRTGFIYVNAMSGSFGYLSAYNPTNGELAWQKRFSGPGQAGPAVTAGGLVFAGTGDNDGYFFAFDAKTGDLLWKFNTGAGIFSSPSVYMVNGEQFVTVASGGGERGHRGGDLILSFALPKR